MERESANLDREFRIAEQSYGTDHLDLVRYLAQHHQEILGEFQKLAAVEAAAA